MTRSTATEWVFFRDLSGRWRWEQRGEGKTLLESSEGFVTRQECMRDAERSGFITGLPHIQVKSGGAARPSE
jgi:hypothetical protein